VEGVNCKNIHTFHDLKFLQFSTNTAMFPARCQNNAARITLSHISKIEVTIILASTLSSSHWFLPFGFPD